MGVRVPAKLPGTMPVTLKRVGMPLGAGSERMERTILDVLVSSPGPNMRQRGRCPTKSDTSVFSPLPHP